MFATIIQDCIFVGSGGRKRTTKSLALATRQITGSQALTEILNRFGHCASHSVALTYATALALLNLKNDVSIPSGIREGFHTTLVCLILAKKPGQVKTPLTYQMNHNKA